MTTRFDFAAIGLDTCEVAERTGFTRRSVQRWKVTGIPWRSADVVAIRLGSHPACIWPEWNRVA